MRLPIDRHSSFPPRLRLAWTLIVTGLALWGLLDLIARVAPGGWPV